MIWHQNLKLKSLAIRSVASQSITLNWNLNSNFLLSLQVRAQGSTEGDLSTQRSHAKRIFGISSSSRIGWIIHSYLCLIPGFANNQEMMAETTELFDNWLKLELLDHFERMTTKKRMSSVSMQQWLVGAAFHLHVRIHQVRADKKNKTTEVKMNAFLFLRHLFFKLGCMCFAKIRS